MRPSIYRGPITPFLTGSRAHLAPSLRNLNPFSTPGVIAHHSSHTDRSHSRHVGCKNQMFGSKLFTSTSQQKMTTFRARKKILPPQKKTPFPGILRLDYNHGRLFHHHTFFIACCLWDCFRMAVWSVLILATRSTLEQTSSYILFHSSSVKHLAGWNFSISEWSLVHLLCSSSTGVDFIL